LSYNGQDFHSLNERIGINTILKERQLFQANNTVLFDLDGTIINSLPVSTGNLKRALDHFGIKPPADTQLTGLFSRGETEILHTLGLEGNFLEEVRSEWANQTRLHAAELTFFDGMRELILRVKENGCPVGIVTGRTRKHFKDIAIGNEITDMMDVIVLEGDIPEAKPDPRTIWYALEQLGVSPAQAFYVGDSPNDMECACRAGCQAVLVTWGVAGSDAGFPYKPHHVVSSPQELEILLLEITRFAPQQWQGIP
jgi:HAD superfamily hydrolase (TIGR01549 family)